MRAFRPIPLLIVGLLAGCAEGPFVDMPITQSVEKPADQVLQTGTVSVCHADSSPWAEIEALAQETCAKYGYESGLTAKRRWDCRMTAPHRAVFTCSVPGMVDELGRPINPSNKEAVDAWRKRTGKSVPKPARVVPGAPAASATTTPAFAPAAVPAAAVGSVAPLRLLTPAAIAGKPAMAPAPLVTPIPQAAPAAAPAGDGFTLDSGSWGQHFEE